MSREFDGVGYYDWPGIVLVDNPCFSAWAQIASSSGLNRAIIGKQGASNLFDTWAALRVDQDDKLVMHISNGAGMDITGATTLVPDMWYLLGGQYDGNAITVWVNGVVDGTNTIGSTALAAGGVPYVGNSARYSPFDGLLENVAYWYRGLLPEEWASLYEGTSPSRLNNVAPTLGASLGSHWPLWGFYSDEPSIASDDTLVEQGSLSAGDVYEQQGAPWSVAG